MIFEQFQTVATDTLARFIRPIFDIIAGHGSRWFFVYIVSSVLIAFIVLFLRNRVPGAGLAANIENAFRSLFPKKVLLHPSAKLDYRYAVVNHFVTSAIVIYLLVGINVMSSVFYSLFAAIPMFDGLNIAVGVPGAILIVLLYAFAFDTSNFFQHLLQHKVPILWEFHKVHHSAEVLTPVTAVRLHPVGQLTAATTGAVVYGCLNGLTYNIFAGEAAAYALFGANLFAFLYYTIGLYHLKHSHVWFTYPPIIKEIFASPSLHLIHHSNRPQHYDTNFGFVFTFWDRVFGTYYEPNENEQHDLILGISESEGRDDYQTVGQLYTTPFKRAWRYHIKPRFHPSFADRSHPGSAGKT